MKMKRDSSGSEVCSNEENNAESYRSTSVNRKSHRLDQGLVEMSPARHMTHGDLMLKLRHRLAKEEEEDRKRNNERRTESVRKPQSSLKDPLRQA